MADLAKSKLSVAVLAALVASSSNGAQADQSAGGEQVEAIFSRTSNGYARHLRADGSFEPETYRFVKGEFWGGDLADPTIDRLTVDDVARTIAPALARQSYVAAQDPSAANLYIIIDWGTTSAPEYRTLEPAFERIEDSELAALDPPSEHGVILNKIPGDTLDLDAIMHGLPEAEANGSANSWNLGGMPSAIDLATAGSGRTTLGDTTYPPIQEGAQLRAEGQMWMQVGKQNARMLGYPDFTDRELQKFRYFVVLRAYDNGTMTQKKPKLLWEVRLSIGEHQNQFDRRLGSMAENASTYFGRDSDGLVHKAMPAGYVRIGRISTLEFPTSADSAALAGDGGHVAYVKRRGSDYGLVVVDVERPEKAVVSRVPAGEPAARVAWGDSTHVRVTLASAEVLSFDTRVKSWSAVPDDLVGENTGARSADKVQAEVADKFPHRTVSILGSDRAGRRYLLAVSGGKGPVRYYVFESQDGVLVDVGRSAPPQ